MRIVVGMFLIMGNAEVISSTVVAELNLVGLTCWGTVLQ